jgi:hypothetical protein
VESNGRYLQIRKISKAAAKLQFPDDAITALHGIVDPAFALAVPGR